MASMKKKMRIIAESQLFSPDDELSAMIRKAEKKDELFEEDLYQVSAASKPEFDKFLKYSRDKKKK